jgi:hypothetical protein
LVVVALLRDHAVFQHDYFIRIADGAQPVCNGEHGSSFRQVFQRFDDQSFRFGVQGCRRFVEDQDGEVPYFPIKDAAASADTTLRRGQNFISSADYGAAEAVLFLQRVFGSLFSYL